MQQCFESFLKSNVDLNTDRYQRIKDAERVLGDFLANDEDIKKILLKITPQGSYKLKTIIKPPKNNGEYDVDLLIHLSDPVEHDPTYYLELIASRFNNSDRYKNITEEMDKTRCITIDYANEFHVDLVPCIHKDSKEFVCNKKTNEFEPTDGDGYSIWFFKQNSKTKQNGLIKVTRLLKYLRDNSKEFETRSIVITTLLGSLIEDSDTTLDLPDLFTVLMKRLNEFLSNYESPPSIFNPALRRENFDRHWSNDPQDFKDFKKFISNTTENAFRALNQNTSFWNDIFGDNFCSSIVSVESNAALIPLGNYSHKEELGERNIQDQSSYPCEAKIRAGLYWGRENDKVINRRFKENIGSNRLISPYHWIKYEIFTNAPEPYKIYWQVVNTGHHATEEKGLRGQLFEGTKQQWERSLYTGKHWIEGFIVSPSNTCIARTGRFYVNFINDSFPLLN